jgi:hypothetical protein
VTATGKYYVAVRDLSPSEGGPGYIYVLSVEVDPNDTVETATHIEPPVIPSIDALIFPAADLDYYRFEALAGQVVTVDLDSAVFNPAQPPAKLVTSLFDAAGNLLGQDAYTSSDPNDPFLQVTLPATGVYFILARELRSFVGTTNTFYQMIVDLGPAAGNETLATGMPVRLPRAVSGTVSPERDLDHFRFDLDASATLRADLDAREDLRSLLVGTLTLLDPAGALATDSSTPDPRLQRLTEPGDYAVGVQGPCSGSGCLSEDSYYVLFLDSDRDGDGLFLPGDNCPLSANLDQADRDGDGAGDVCDNCLATFNPDQRDSDGDGRGDACAACDLPPEVAQDLHFSDADTLAWSAASPAVTYNLYRGLVDGGAWEFTHACLRASLDVPTTDDASVPATGTAFYYLVSGRNACGEGGLGATSAQVERPNESPCP